MERVIKFRAWDNAEKKWLLGYEYPNLGGFSMFGETMLFEEWSHVLNRFILQQQDRTPQDLKLMQFTGLKDKNGTDIYEGDLIVHSSRNGKVPHPIVYKNGAFCGDYGLIYPLFNDHSDLYNEMEVVGNIYEHPHLIQKEKA